MLLIIKNIYKGGGMAETKNKLGKGNLSNEINKTNQRNQINQKRRFELC